MEAANDTTLVFEVFGDNQKLSAAGMYPVGKKLQLDISFSNGFRIAWRVGEKMFLLIQEMCWKANANPAEDDDSLSVFSGGVIMSFSMIFICKLLSVEYLLNF